MVRFFRSRCIWCAAEKSNRRNSHDRLRHSGCERLKSLSAPSVTVRSCLMKWNHLPKVELHLHMDTSLSYEGVAQLDPSVTHDDYLRDFAGPEQCADLADFLSHVPPIINLLQTEQGLRVLVRDMFRQLVEDHMLYAELRFAPLQHLERGLTARDVVRIIEA
ncbi:hypothetical protein FBR02_20145, partial [Anaerolineae bacterium CFX9]|nr:hypothetical protein [Anaerolineae bacterium CFX9]